MLRAVCHHCRCRHCDKTTWRWCGRSDHHRRYFLPRVFSPFIVQSHSIQPQTRLYNTWAATASPTRLVSKAMPIDNRSTTTPCTCQQLMRLAHRCKRRALRTTSRCLCPRAVRFDVCPCCSRRARESLARYTLTTRRHLHAPNRQNTLALTVFWMVQIPLVSLLSFFKILIVYFINLIFILFFSITNNINVFIIDCHVYKIIRHDCEQNTVKWRRWCLLFSHGWSHVRRQFSSRRSKRLFQCQCSS